MLTKSQYQELLNLGLSTGADFAEFFFEDTNSYVTRVFNGEVTSIDMSNTYGVGVRLIQGVDVVYGYTNDTSFESIQSVIQGLIPSFSGPAATAKPIGEALPYSNTIKKPPRSVSSKEKADKLVAL